MTEPILEVRDLRVSFKRGSERVQALRGVTLDVARGETVALVGESGSGKSTVARAIMRLCPIESGEVVFAGEPIQALRGRRLLAHRRRTQMVFQDPYSSLDPALTIERSVGEPLEVHEGSSRAEIHDRVEELLDRLALPPRSGERYPHEFSGGQRQRIAIARALIAQPDLLILDEATSALDAPTRKQIVGQLVHLQNELDLSYLFIAHDLDLVRRVADRVVVMYLGKVVEAGPTQSVFADPQHPYTRALLAAIPLADPRVQRARARTVIVGEPPDPAHPPQGCAFRTRCPDASDACLEDPPLVQVDQRTAACVLVSRNDLVTSGQ